jgi:hypothetical protein
VEVGSDGPPTNEFDELLAQLATAGEIASSWGGWSCCRFPWSWFVVCAIGQLQVQVQLVCEPELSPPAREEGNLKKEGALVISHFRKSEARQPHEKKKKSPPPRVPLPVALIASI